MDALAGVLVHHLREQSGRLGGRFDRRVRRYAACPALPGGPILLSDRVLKKGMKGTDVKAMQELLIASGYPLRQHGADGSFGDETETAVKAFQKAMRLTVDGIVGEKTLSALIAEATASEAADAPDSPDLSVAPPATAGKLIVTGGTVNVRTGPGTQYDVATRVKQSDLLEAVPVGGWIPVMIGGRVLWVSGQYVKAI